MSVPESPFCPLPPGSPGNPEEKIYFHRIVSKRIKNNTYRVCLVHHVCPECLSFQVNLVDPK